MIKARALYIKVLTLVTILAASGSVLADDFTANAVVSRTSASVGVPFTFQIQVKVEGSKNPQDPQIPDIPGLKIVSQGRQTQSTYSFNGFKQTSFITYFYTYSLTPTRKGEITIPPIKVSVGGKTKDTKPIKLTIGKAVESSSSKLRITASKPKCFEGEPVTVKIKWYFSTDVNNINLVLPFTENPDIEWHPITPTGNRRNLYEFKINGRSVIARQDSDILNGKKYNTLTMELALMIRRPGPYELGDGALISFDAKVGTKRRKRGSLFDDDFFSDPFTNPFSRRGIYKKQAAPSNPMPLTVLPVPLTGKPKNFSGLVGQYSCIAEATPTDVAVGDPITITIKLAGPDYLEGAKIPRLSDIPEMNAAFKIPVQRAAGKVSGLVKTFTQTIRARNAEVDAIPPIRIPYFDTESGKYAFATTQKIPLKVKAVRILTSSDVEGRTPTATAGQTLESWQQGIAHNYERIDALQDLGGGTSQLSSSPLRIALLIAPPTLYFLLLFATTFIRRRNSDPARVAARKAYGEFSASLSAISASPDKAHDETLEAIRKYVSARLRLPPGAITFKDIQQPLKEHGADENTITNLKAIFEECEAACYAGGGGNASSVIAKSREAIKQLEGMLK